MTGLVVGLGNPGSSFAHTRHNIGFDVLDSLALRLSLDFKKQPRFSAYVASYKVLDHTFFLVKPTTFMNFSGQSVARIGKFYKVDFVLVVHDDLDLGLGTLRFKWAGSSAGHNGLKSLDCCYGNEYFRMRLGIGRDRKKTVNEYVLERFSLEEMQIREELLRRSVNALIDWLSLLSSTEDIWNSFEKIRSTHSFKLSIKT